MILVFIVIQRVCTYVKVMAVRVQKTVRFCCTPLVTSCESLDSSSGGGESLESLDQLDDVETLDWVDGKSGDAVSDFLSALEAASVSKVALVWSFHALLM